jgi:magnesium chelatase family protein
MTSREVRKYCPLSSACSKLLRHSVEDLGLSARAHDKILRVSRTIADVEGAETINETHLAEAINYRSLDSDLWT